MPVRDVERQLTRALLVVLVGAAALRLIGSVAAGFITLAQRAETFPTGRERTAQILTSFGTAGDTIEALLLLAVVVLLWRGVRQPGPVPPSAVRLMLLLTAVLVALRVAGTLVIDFEFAAAHAAAQETVVVTFGIADALLCLGGLGLMGHLGRATPELDLTGPEPIVFAVDRGNGEVFAFFSYAEAARTISPYSVEDDEFTFYTDDGRVVVATTTDGRMQLTPTDIDQRDELLAQLRRFAEQKSLRVDDAGDTTAYALPISEWQWLELWPGWMRGVGRLSRRLRGL